MRLNPGINPRAARVLPWLVALTALSMFGISLASAETFARPPVSPAAIKQATGTAAEPKSVPEESKAAPKAGASVEPKASAAGEPKASAGEPKASAPVAPKSAAPAPRKMAAAEQNSEAASDSGMTLRGGQERTDFRTMTVEGEDRVHLEVERPPLVLDLNPEKVGGLESGSAADVLNRTAPDLMTAYLESTAHGPEPYLARPWLSQFATGSVARFQPNVKDVERWKLVVADSKGQSVKTYQGKGDPPKEIAWDGRSQDGATVTPGLTYSYIFEAYDRAGNKRNFVGEGFRVSAYRIDTPDGQVLVFSGQSIFAAQKSGRAFGMGADGTTKAVPPVILEAAGWLNQGPRLGQAVRVTATGRSFEQANLLAGRVSAALADLALGDPARIQTVAEVLPDAPDGGSIRIASTLIASTPLNSKQIRSNSKAR